MLQFEATHVIRCGRYVALCIIRCSWKSSRCASTARVFTQGYSLVSSPALPTLQDMPSLMPAYPCTNVATSCRITIVESQARAVRARPVIVQTPSGAAAAVLFQRRGCMTVSREHERRLRVSITSFPSSGTGRAAPAWQRWTPWTRPSLSGCCYK